MTPEFSRPHRLDAIGAGDRSVAVDADEGERKALARRFGLIAIDRLHASGTIRQDATGIVMRGHLSGAVVQACSISGDPVPAIVEEDFSIRFVPEAGAGEDEVELTADDCDTVFFAGSAIDVGEAVAETLALALDPFPRGPTADTALRDAGVLSEEDTGPFAALAALKKKLK
ncbi:YceD family protein [Sphingomonas sp. LT1P40]|uniref:YceD family protein n=1 Tax=Alteristakelama amylovorans TaxID=3096166 RepID=UPI002FC7E2F9